MIRSGGEMASAQRAPLWSSVVSLCASGSTLVCCAIPALLVAFGAGAALSTLVSVFPQIVWLSEHKEMVFGLATALLLLGGVMQWRNRTAPCPVDPALRDACLRTRRFSLRVYGASMFLLAIGGWFAFVQPWLGGG
jgi:hypothetical protein